MKTLALVVAALLPLAAAAQSPAGATSSQPLTVVGGRTLLYVGPISHIGTPPKNTTNLKDPGSAPFLVMFQRILPTGWTVWQGNVTEPLPSGVSWTGGKPWYDSLGEVLLQNSLRADVNWNDKSVVLHTQRLVTPGISAQAPAAAASRPPATAAAPAPAAPLAAESAPRQEVTIWSVTPQDVSLRAVMQRWARDAQWTVVYEASNYAFDSFGEFEGEYKLAVCRVLANINASLAESKKTAPLNAGFWNGNRTVRIFDQRPDVVVNAPETCNGKNAGTKPASADKGNT